MNESNFWQALDELIHDGEIVIDRPGGSAHPDFPDLIYPFDYGYLAGTQSSDGGGVDVWIGTAQPLQLCGLVQTVDVAKRDAEIKLLYGCHPGEVEQIVAFHNRGSQFGLHVPRRF